MQLASHVMECAVRPSAQIEAHPGGLRTQIRSESSAHRRGYQGTRATAATIEPVDGCFARSAHANGGTFEAGMGSHDDDLQNADDRGDACSRHDGSRVSHDPAPGTSGLAAAPANSRALRKPDLGLNPRVARREKACQNPRHDHLSIHALFRATEELNRAFEGRLD